MTPSDTRDLASDHAAERFIVKSNGIGVSELSTAQSFLIDLCHLLCVETPHPTPEQSYMLFKQPDTLPLDKPQLAMLIQAAKAKWDHVEPEIFGTSGAGAAGDP